MSGSSDSMREASVFRRLRVASSRAGFRWSFVPELQLGREEALARLEALDPEQPV
ncbi:hypothetical protein [Pseudonocardia alaniniphila]|uniref:Uncharacterized protein n=1 Tax=Pseudonocardia alaniniphila TaxID=75291 RepID=A0ABS9TCF7_9PSEU|nr:hypothetical protein [Pseudonocardia alaniniphila]MCH6166226.1 hypothetical protein [Pseudonocardia alaniniphila]